MPQPGATFTPAPAAGGLLAEIVGHFTDRGWSLDHLARFRMDASATAPTLPEIPADLAGVADDELGALLGACEEYARTVGETGVVDDDTLATLEAMAVAVEQIRAEQDTRATQAAERAQRLADLTGRIVPAAPPAETAPAAPAATPAAPAAAPAPAAEPVAAAATPGTALAVPPLAATPTPATSPPAREVIRPDTVIVAGADVPRFAAGQRLEGLEGIAEALIARRDALTQPTHGGSEEKIIVASAISRLPEERHLYYGQEAANADKVRAVTSPAAIVAAGGLCAPVEPYYDLMVLANAQRPVRDALAGFTADRGGITYLPAPKLSNVAATPRTVADGATTNTSPTVTSATAAFDARDVGASISGAGIPAGAYIVAVTNATTVTISANASATATGVTLTITRKGAIGTISMAQDAAALNGTAAQIVAGTKPVIHVTCPAPQTAYVQAITRQLEFGNFTARAYPEQVAAWTRLALSQQARIAETALLDGISAASTQVTVAKVLGAARDLVAQVVRAAAYFRNVNRMDEEAPLRWMGPAWVIDLMVADLTRGSGYEAEFFAVARDEVRQALAGANVRATYYVDSGTGKGQFFNAGNAMGNGAHVTFPSTVVHYLFPEGSFLFLDGGTLDLGLVRDSALNNLNNYRMFAETFEGLAFVGVESLEITSTVVADGTYAGTAYGSSTVGAPVAFPTAF
jgi:hypothetical protein